MIHSITRQLKADSQTRKAMRKRCAVIGNPVEHSRSPEIHQHFAEQFGISLEYDKLLSDEISFSKNISEFFQSGGLGLNVTLPFKHLAYEIADTLTEEATIAQSVNTLFIDAAGKLCGDTTDGRGLLKDLQRLHIIRPEPRVLILGAGGAARAITPALLKLNCRITLINRTPQNARLLAAAFTPLGEIKLCSTNEPAFDLIINTMPQDGEHWLKQYSITQLEKTNIYDINYGKRARTFLEWCREQNCLSSSDGWGMLVEQAALSFEIWHKCLPNTELLHSKAM